MPFDEYNIDLFMGSLLIHFGQGVMTVAVCSIQYVPPLRRKSAPMIIVGPVVWWPLPGVHTDTAPTPKSPNGPHCGQSPASGVLGVLTNAHTGLTPLSDVSPVKAVKARIDHWHAATGSRGEKLIGGAIHYITLPLLASMRYFSSFVTLLTFFH